MGGSQEEVVKEFIRELQSMVETRPPISKAKMMSITKAALKAVKFYKHIVMNVEKFISKCKPEYKIPGLYVIDSVIRQSRHQYGIDKDVYGSRFGKNIINILQHVEKCPTEDKNKISRVLNLWEKNSIFSPDLIKQLFEAHQSCVNTSDLSVKIEFSTDKQSGEKTSGGTDFDRFRELQETLMRASSKGDTDTTSILTEIQQITNQLLESHKKPTTTNNSSDEPSSTTQSIINPPEPMQSNVANVLDDFDYGSDNDDDEPRGQTITNIPSNFPSNNTQQTMQFLQPPTGMLINPNHANTVSFPVTDANNLSMSMSFDPTRPPPIFFQQPLPSSLSSQQQQINYDATRQMLHQPIDVDLRPEDMEADNSDEHHHHRMTSSPSRHRYNRRRSRSRSRSREPKRTRSSSNSMNRRDSAASRLKETEKRERRRKGLPPLKEDHLVVSSRTLWLGHLPKIISEIDLREQLEPHGEISDINHIPPRGCAFVCFKERSDASRCLEKMKDFRFHGNPIKIAWAMNKGVKDRFKEFWDADHGCTYIPYSELKDIPNLTTLAEGGTIDDESMPSFLKSTVQPTRVDVPPMMHQQSIQPLVQPHAPFAHQEFQPPPNLPPRPTTVHLDTSNRLAPGSTILMAPSHDSSIRVGLPVQMMPPGAQIIQVQQHPHGQPMQVVQHITGRVFPNSQIVHQMPYGHVVTTNQHPPSIQLQHHHSDLKDFNTQALQHGGGLHLLTSATVVPTHHHFMSTTSIAAGAPLTTATFAHTVDGSALIQFHDDSHRRLSPSIQSTHYDEHHRHNLTSTDEQLVHLATSSSSARFPPPLLGESPSPNRMQPHHQFGNSMLQGQPQSLLATPTKNDEHQKQLPFPRRPNRFEEREDTAQTQDNNGNYSGYHGERNSYNDRTNSSAISRGSNRGRGGGGNQGGRGYYSNNDRGGRLNNNDNNGGGFRGRSGFHRGGRDDTGTGNSSGQTRFFSRGNNRGGNQDHSLPHQSSRSPDRRSSSYRNDHNIEKYSSTTSGFSAPLSDEFSHRSLPIEALRRKDQSNIDSSSNKSSLMIDETIGSRSGHTD
ncbi:unnamed protein product [Rotaria magnacalcarata]|uniref:Uncharacterized protein n=1 Tax=Rotaria magnacalcarata TaxID=392030 RepID=A0A816VXW7_9BILA|nr:unnamed protein product [Rotaria magnacalcarata]CAF2133424.1 unnamed protein product [Rotaria magnacalcarata]CAF3742939.1 unnamed protein product [Rotaria magnacalcarata]CAF3758583.1 unnamed protein product [Rotaria magnacalcarata]